MAEIHHLENRHDVIFFCRVWSDLDKISQTGAKWHVDCGDMVEIETRCRIPIWRTFGRIQWHVIPEPHATLQGAVTGPNQCRDRATLQGFRIPSVILKIIFHHILFFWFFNAVWALTSGGFRIVSDTLVCFSRCSGYIYFSIYTVFRKNTHFCFRA